MRSTISRSIPIAASLLIFICLIVPAAFASSAGGSISGRIAFNTGNQSMPDGTVVSLVNGYNVSEYVPGFNNSTPGQDGTYKFVDIPLGFYKVYAWSPYCAEGYSAGVNVTTNDTYTTSVVLMPMPYYANITADRQSVPYGGQAGITVQASDYWGRSVGPGWKILLNTTVGTMDPSSAITDKDGKIRSSIAWVDNSTPANITVFAVATNNSSYPLLASIETAEAATPTAAPTAPANATATPSAAPSAAPNATATAGPTATLPAATPSSVPTPGFELIAALAAVGLALAIRRNK